MRRSKGEVAAIAALFGMAMAGAANAQDKPADGADDAICADRPGKPFAVCTVPKGKWQVEADVYNQSWLRNADMRQTTTLYTNPTIKYGVADGIDVQAAITPWQTVRTRDLASGTQTTQRGVGDLTLQAKFSLSKTVTLLPFVTAPTATQGLGSGGWGGGLRIPIGGDLGGGWSYAVTPEVDAVHDADRRGTHVATVQVAGVSRDLGHGFNAGVDLWAAWNFDPAGETRQASLDFSLAWIPPAMTSIQLDAQVYAGLTRDTPDVNVIVGVAKRF